MSCYRSFAAIAIASATLIPPAFAARPQAPAASMPQYTLFNYAIFSRSDVSLRYGDTAMIGQEQPNATSHSHVGAVRDVRTSYWAFGGDLVAGGAVDGRAPNGSMQTGMYGTAYVTSAAQYVGSYRIVRNPVNLAGRLALADAQLNNQSIELRRLGGQPAAISQDGRTAVFAAQAQGVSAFTVTAEQLSALSTSTLSGDNLTAPPGEVVISGTQNSTVVINVSGDAVNMQAIQYTLRGGIGPQNIVWNFFEATSVRLYRWTGDTFVNYGIPGTFLAPCAVFEMSALRITGAVYAAKVKNMGIPDVGNAQVNYVCFEGGPLAQSNQIGCVNGVPVFQQPPPHGGCPAGPGACTGVPIPYPPQIPGETPGGGGYPVPPLPANR